MIEPSAASQKFLLIGFKQEPGTPGVVIHLDFSLMHKRPCAGANSPGQTASDFEHWSPYDGRHGGHCLLGR